MENPEADPGKGRGKEGGGGGGDERGDLSRPLKLAQGTVE